MKKKVPDRVARDAPKQTLATIHRRNLAEWRIASARQQAENRPLDFPDRFPKKADWEVLMSSVWWWRFKDDAERAKRIFPCDAPEGEDRTRRMLEKLNNLHELSAWFYEFRARYKNRYRWDFGRPWIRCTDEQWKTLSSMIQIKEPAQVPVSLNRRGDHWVALNMFWVNLRLNDAVLERQFLDHVAELRRVHRVNPPGLGHGVRRKPLPWTPIEFMDIRHYKIRTLTESERSQLSKARSLYVELCERLELEP